MDNQNGFSTICSKCGRTLYEGEMLNIKGSYVCESCASAYIFERKSGSTIRKRMPSSFFHFCFSLMPGAGHMYLGLMKTGLFQMCAFFISIYLTPFYPMLFGMVIPIVWFYSFFDSISCRRKICNGEYVPDRFFDENSVIGRYKGIIAAVLLFLMIFGSIFGGIARFAHNYLFGAFGYMHHRGGSLGLLLPVILIGLGVLLVNRSRKKKKSDKSETFDSEN